MSIDEKAMDKIIDTPVCRGLTGARLLEVIEAYEAAKTEQPDELAWEKIAMETHSVNLILIDEIANLMKQLERESGSGKPFIDNPSEWVKKEIVAYMTEGAVSINPENRSLEYRMKLGLDALLEKFNIQRKI